MVGALPDGGGAHLAQPVEHNAQLVAMRLAVEHVQLDGRHAVHMDCVFGCFTSRASSDSGMVSRRSAGRGGSKSS